jgi:hypothetical protein
MHDFGDFVFSFWWLIFPLMGFVFAGWGMYLNHRRSQNAMEILRAYAAQGKDPPPEVLAAVTGVQPGAAPGAAPGVASGVPPYGVPPYSPYAWGPWGWGWGWGSRWAWRGPMWMWSRVVIFAAIAIGFGMAGQYGDEPHTDHAFHMVAIVMSVLAVGFGFMALMHTLFTRNAPKP